MTTLTTLLNDVNAALAGNTNIDRIEIWVENTTGSSDITASVGGQLIVSRF